MRESEPKETGVRIERARQVAAVVKALPIPVKRVVLVGSTARGEARPESDIDICVTFDNELSRNHIVFHGGEISTRLQQEGFQTGSHIRMGIDLAFIRDEDPEKAEQFPERMRPRLEEIRRDGIEL